MVFNISKLKVSVALDVVSFFSEEFEVKVCFKQSLLKETSFYAIEKKIFCMMYQLNEHFQINKLTMFCLNQKDFYRETSYILPGST